MRLTPSFGFAVLVGSALGLPALLADDAKPSQGAQEAARRLDGNWKVVALEADGKKAPANVLPGMRWVIQGSELQAFDPGEKTPGKGSMKIDTSKSPAHIDLVGLDGALKGQTMRGIFKFEKDRLIVCLREEQAAKKGRPKEFATEAESGLGMITLERINK